MTRLQDAIDRLSAVGGGGLVALPDENATALEDDIAVVLAALSTPPADDVREALELLNEFHASGRMNYDDYSEMHTLLSIIARSPDGTVTDPSDTEVLAALNATVKPESAAPDLSFWGEETAAQMRASLKAAAEVRERAEA